MDSRPLRFGILGCARIVRRAIVAGLRTAPSAEAWSIASRRPEQAAAWAAELGIPHHFSSYEALLDDPNVDAVYIPLPNELHRPWVLRAAAAGKHVLCEKPLALDAGEAEAIVAGCHEANVQLMEAFMWRHHPRVAHARQMLRSGQLGELRLVKMDFSFDIDRDDWRLDPQRGGGALYDLGCYGINAARLFTGEEPAEIFARARYHVPSVELTLAMELRFPGGVVALLDCSFECPYRNRLEIVGTRAAIEFPDGVLPPPQAELRIRRGEVLEVVPFATADQYAEQIEAFCQAIRTGRLPEPAEDGLANMRVLTDVRAAAGR